MAFRVDLVRNILNKSSQYLIFKNSVSCPIQIQIKYSTLQNVKDTNNNTTTTTNNNNNNSKGESSYVITGNKRVDSLLDQGKVKLFEVMSIYEEAIGLKEIKQAQQSVLEAEKKFVDAQKMRRDLNTKILDIQAKLRNLRDEMDRLNRTDSRYLQLFTEEHNILKSEVVLMNEYKTKENEERDLFFYLSAALRDAQEKERARVERTKYLQLGLSIACTVLGIFSAYLLSYFRNANIREILTYEKIQFTNTHSMINDVINKQIEISENFEKKLSFLADENSKIIENQKRIEESYQINTLKNETNPVIDHKNVPNKYMSSNAMIPVVALFGFLLFYFTKS